MDRPLLRIDGEVERPLCLSFEELASFPEAELVRDTSRFHPGRPGDGVCLEALLKRVQPRPTATWLTLHASHDDFAASVPLEAVRQEGIVVFQLDGRPLPESRGGPFRFLIRDPAACRTDELDDCANVKFVDRIELSAGRGRDTRPQDEDEHRALHEAESAQRTAEP